LNTLGLLLLAAIVVALGYTWSCAVYPYRPCRSCHGVGHFRSPILRAIRLCRRCNGTGRTLRIGRRAYNTSVRLRRAIRRSQGR
jgi:DnaJ-class molecular chaperone